MGLTMVLKHPHPGLTLTLLTEAQDLLSQAPPAHHGSSSCPVDPTPQCGAQLFHGQTLEGHSLAETLMLLKTHPRDQPEPRGIGDREVEKEGEEEEGCWV